MPLDFTEFDEQEREAGVMEDVEDLVTTHYSPDTDFKWPELPNKKKKLDPLPPAPIEAMPTVLRKICNEVAETYKVPIEVPMLNALSIAGFAAGKHHKAKIGPVVVRPNLYTACFQAPGERKSSGFSSFVKPVHDWIEDQMPEWIKASRENKILKGKISRIEDDITKGRCEDEHSARLELDKLENQKLNSSPRYVMGDASEGAMADRMQETGGSVMVASSDAKTILSIIMGKFTNGATEDGLMLQSYDGGEPFMSSRRQSGTVHVPDPMMGVCIMTQVNQLKKLAEKGDLFASGLISRLMFCFPDAMAGKRGDDGELLRKFSKREVSKDIQKQYNELICTLLDYSQKMHSPIYVPIDSDAEDEWEKFQNSIESELGGHGDYADCSDIAIRLPVHAFRLALILAICHNPAHPSICKLDVMNGIKLAKYYWKHMERALNMMSKRNIPDIPRRIIRSLQGKHEHILNTRTVQRRLNDVSAERMMEGIEWLLDNGYLREIEVIGGNNGGRPKNPDYEVNPAILGD
jgi:hypothetical protein